MNFIEREEEVREGKMKMYMGFMEKLQKKELQGNAVIENRELKKWEREEKEKIRKEKERERLR